MMCIKFIEIKLIYSIHWYYDNSLEFYRYYDYLCIMNVDIEAILIYDVIHAYADLYMYIHMMIIRAYDVIYIDILIILINYILLDAMQILICYTSQ